MNKINSLRLLVFGFFAIFSTPALSERVEGVLACKVKNNFLTRMEGGEPKFYNGFEGGTLINDTIRFNYIGYDDTDFENVYISFKDEFKGVTYFSYLFSSKDMIWGRSGVLSGFVEETINYPTRIIISQKTISIQDYEKSLLLKQYADEKYEGVYSRILYSSKDAQIFNLDCRALGNDLVKFTALFD